MLLPSLTVVQAVMHALGYAFFTRGDYNLNIVGVRARNVAGGKSDDTLCVFYRRYDLWQSEFFHAAPSHDADIVKAGQYRSAYQLNNNNMLVRREPATVFRNGIIEYACVTDWQCKCASSIEQDRFINLCRKSRELYGNSFTYTLIDAKDLGYE